MTNKYKWDTSIIEHEQNEIKKQIEVELKSGIYMKCKCGPLTFLIQRVQSSFVPGSANCVRARAGKGWPGRWLTSRCERTRWNAWSTRRIGIRRALNNPPTNGPG